MTPENALELLLSATTVAKLTKEDHVRCEQAYAVVKAALTPPPTAGTFDVAVTPGPNKKKKAAKKKAAKKAPKATKKRRRR